MLLRDLTDLGAWIKRIIFRLDRIESGAHLENASVTNGRLRFIGGLLLIDSGGTLTVIGHLNGSGDFVWSGPWAFTGQGEITGDVGITGNLELLDDGRFDAGGVSIRDGKIYVGSGANQVVIDGATGKITAGNLTIDPTVSGGAVVFANGSQVFTDSDTIQLYKGNSVAQVHNDYARIQHGGDVVEINGDGVRMSPGAIANASSSEGLRWLAIDPSTGYLQKIDPAFGGPGGGLFDWPFPEATITYGFRPPDRPTHDGIDFSYGGIGGDPIPAASAGVVAFAGWSDGYGNYVDLTHAPIGGQSVMTRYAHMQTLPVVVTGQTVAKGQTLGPVGDTGNSFGDHLHWEVHLDGEPVDPAIFMQQHGS